MVVRPSLFPYPASPAAVQDLEPALVEAGCKDTIHTYVAEAIVNGIEPSWHKLCNELQKHVSVGAIAAAYDALTAYFAYSVDLFDTHAALQRALPALLSAWRNAMEGARDPTEIMLAQIIHVIGGRASADTHLPADCRLRGGLVLLDGFDRAELNGRIARVIGDYSEGRVTVRLQSEASAPQYGVDASTKDMRARIFKLRPYLPPDAAAAAAPRCAARIGEPSTHGGTADANRALGDAHSTAGVGNGDAAEGAADPEERVSQLNLRLPPRQLAADLYRDAFGESLPDGLMEGTQRWMVARMALAEAQIAAAGEEEDAEYPTRLAAVNALVAALMARGRAKDGPDPQAVANAIAAVHRCRGIEPGRIATLVDAAESLISKVKASFNSDEMCDTYLSMSGMPLSEMLQGVMFPLPALVQDAAPGASPSSVAGSAAPAAPAAPACASAAVELHCAACSWCARLFSSVALTDGPSIPAAWRRHSTSRYKVAISNATGQCLKPLPARAGVSVSQPLQTAISSSRRTTG